MALDQRIVRSRQALKDSARELFMKNPMASLSDVAKHAGVGRATLYRHYESREQLIQELALESLTATEAVLAPLSVLPLSSWDYLLKSLAEIMPLAEKYHFLLAVWEIASADEDVSRMYGEQLSGLSAVVDMAKAEGAISPALTTEWVCQLYDAVLYVGWNCVRSGSMDIDEAVAHAQQTLSSGVAPTQA
ncbi:Uncharacterised protein [BD1-7 clade bacterium]|nr:Uncharacterised protein [BD1-7 clade bacterium]